MPIYEYKCGNGHTFDQIVKFDLSDAPTACAECGDTNIKRKISVPASAIFNAPDFPGNEMKSGISRAIKEIKKADKDRDNVYRDHGVDPDRMTAAEKAAVIRKETGK